MPRAAPCFLGALTGSRGAPVTRTAGPNKKVKADLSADGAGGVSITLYNNWVGTACIHIEVRSNSFNGTLYNGSLADIEKFLPPFDATKKACLTKETLRNALINIERYSEDRQSKIWAQQALSRPTPEQRPRRRR